MALIRPSLTLVLDLDTRAAGKSTVLEINRSYAHITTPVVRTHEPEHEDAPVRNVARMIVNLGTSPYFDASAEGAEANWRDIVEPWIGNMLRKIGNNMKVFNDRQRKIGLPEVNFDTLDIEMAGSTFTVKLHPEPAGAVDPACRAIADAARTLVADGTFAGAVAVEAPTAASFAEQREAAWGAWVAEHPEALAEAEGGEEAEGEEAPAGTEEAAPAEPKTREQLLEEDRIAKSYENTAVAPTDSEAIPRPAREEVTEPDPFTFPVDYTLWTVTFADGHTSTYDSAAGAFAE